MKKTTTTKKKNKTVKQSLNETLKILIFRDRYIY